MNTRFNPTANGYLHLGHLYLALVNQHVAKRTGGKFIVQIDDNQDHWRQMYGQTKINHFVSELKRDLEWAGLEPSEYVIASEEEETNKEYCLNLACLEMGPVASYPMANVNNWVTLYPFVPELTALKVAQDYRNKIDIVIRGIDLLTEFSLYAYFCKMLKFPLPRHHYIPLFKLNDKPLSSNPMRGEISQKLKVRDYREKGWNNRELIELMEETCLIVRLGGWDFENIQFDPGLFEN